MKSNRPAIICLVLLPCLLFGCLIKPRYRQTMSSIKNASPSIRKTGKVKFELSDIKLRVEDISTVNISGIVGNCSYEMEEYRIVRRSHFRMVRCSVCNGSGKRADAYFNCGACGGSGQRRHNTPVQDRERIRAFWNSVVVNKIQISSDRFKTTYLPIDENGYFSGTLSTKGGHFVDVSNMNAKAREYIEKQDVDDTNITIRPSTNPNVGNIERNHKLRSPSVWIPQ